MKLIPGNIATRAARTKVPAQVGCAWCKPVDSELGKSSSSVFSLWGPISLRRLCHHLAAAGQWGREESCRLWLAKSRLSTMTYTVWNSIRYPQCRRTCSKISSQWGRPISSVTSYSNGAALPNLAPGSPTTNLALVSKLSLPWWSPGRSVHNWSQNCWKFTPLGVRKTRSNRRHSGQTPSYLLWLLLCGISSSRRSRIHVGILRRRFCGREADILVISKRIHERRQDTPPI